MIGSNKVEAVIEKVENKIPLRLKAVASRTLGGYSRPQQPQPIKKYTIKTVSDAPVGKRKFTARPIQPAKFMKTIEKKKVAQIVYVEDDEEDVIELAVGSKIRSNSGRIYRIRRNIGSGTFGEVYEILDHFNNVYAMKVVKNENPTEIRNNKIETEIWRVISTNSAADDPLLRCEESFNFGIYKCFIMDRMDCDLYTTMRKGPMPVEKLAKVAKQLFTAISRLNSLGLVHCDLKQENIMLVSSKGPNPLQIKLIDFGVTMRTSELQNHQGSILQTEQLRAPEVILGLPLDEKMDIWSVGVILFELYVNRSLYSARSETVALREIAELFGLPDNYYEGKRFGEFMKTDSETGEDNYLKEVKVDQKVKEMRNLYKMLELGYSIRSSSQLSPADHHFLSLLRLLLKTNSCERISAEEALKHPFITSI